MACGGTRLDTNKNKITNETVWNELAKNEGATGGGVSRIFPIPTYQNSAGVPVHPETKFAGRGVPDVALHTKALAAACCCAELGRGLSGALEGFRIMLAERASTSLNNRGRPCRANPNKL